jgi:hypothetical protein
MASRREPFQNVSRKVMDWSRARFSWTAFTAISAQDTTETATSRARTASSTGELCRTMER